VAVSIAPFIARLRMNPGRGTDGSTVISNVTLVLKPSGDSVYFALERQLRPVAPRPVDRPIPPRPPTGHRIDSRL
jgi:hypothetical protein